MDSAQDSDLAHSLEIPKLSEIKPPLKSVQKSKKKHGFIKSFLFFKVFAPITRHLAFLVSIESYETEQQKELMRNSQEWPRPMEISSPLPITATPIGPTQQLPLPAPRPPHCPLWSPSRHITTPIGPNTVVKLV